ncbi:MAG: VCBS repeat-containing protein [Bacteroidetes bacterium]|nr:VCBS repeat-containing protein [Bacteroidota bacterium]
MTHLLTIMSLTSILTTALTLCWNQVAFSQQPQVVAVSPGQNQIASTVQPQIAATISASIDPATITSISFSVFGERSGNKNGTLVYDSTERRVSFTSSTPFIAGERVIASLSRSITSQTGDSLPGFIWTFRIPSARRNELRFENAVVYGGGGWSIECVDMNNDGYADIVSSAGVIRLNNGFGTFNAFWTLPGADPFSKIAVDDFNRDGIMDVCYNANGLRIALSNGDGSFNIQGRPWWFDQYITGDFNSDGFPDIAGLTASSDAWGISFNDGSGIFNDTIVVDSAPATFEWLQTIQTFDVDNNGHLDIVCAAWASINPGGQDGIVVWKGNGDGTFRGPQVYASNALFLFPEQLYSSDFSNDGLADIAVRGYVGSLALNLCGVFGTDTLSTRQFWPAEAPGAMTGGDFNGDGWIDLMVWMETVL